MGTALRTQFERTARTDDLADAVAAIRTALDMQPAADRGTLRPMYQAELSKTLQLWFESTGEEAVIDEAVALARDAAEATPGGHVNVGFYDPSSAGRFNCGRGRAETWTENGGPGTGTARRRGETSREGFAAAMSAHVDRIVARRVRRARNVRIRRRPPA